MPIVRSVRLSARVSRQGSVRLRIRTENWRARGGSVGPAAWTVRRSAASSALGFLGHSGSLDELARLLEDEAEDWSSKWQRETSKWQRKPAGAARLSLGRLKAVEQAELPRPSGSWRGRAWSTMSSFQFSWRM